MDWQKTGAGALSGLFSAVIIDLHAWTRSTGDFDWGLALKRWAAGAISGVAASIGLGGVTP